MNLPQDILSDLAAMEEGAGRASGFLKGLANPQRLLILCCLSQGERHVGALVEATGIGQTSMSQHLARLKAEGIVAVRRDHRMLYYRIDHAAVAQIMQVIHRHFCEGKSE